MCLGTSINSRVFSDVGEGGRKFGEGNAALLICEISRAARELPSSSVMWRPRRYLGLSFEDYRPGTRAIGGFRTIGNRNFLIFLRMQRRRGNIHRGLFITWPPRYRLLYERFTALYIRIRWLIIM